jgi:hypothetical protein
MIHKKWIVRCIGEIKIQEFLFVFSFIILKNNNQKNQSVQGSQLILKIKHNRHNSILATKINRDKGHKNKNQSVQGSRLYNQSSQLNLNVLAK